MASETIYSFSAKDIKGHEVSMDDYRGKVLLIVNTGLKMWFLRPNLRGCSRSMTNWGSVGLRCWVSHVTSS